jgi:hypothetical protein
MIIATGRRPKMDRLPITQHEWTSSNSWSPFQQNLCFSLKISLMRFCLGRDPAGPLWPYSLHVFGQPTLSFLMKLIEQWSEGTLICKGVFAALHCSSVVSSFRYFEFTGTWQLFACPTSIYLYWTPGSLSQYSDGLRAGRPGFESRQGYEVLLFSTTSRPVLVPIQPPIQWVAGATFPGVKVAGTWIWPLTSV